jgi:hypothetical protein
MRNSAGLAAPGESVVREFLQILWPRPRRHSRPSISPIFLVIRALRSKAMWVPCPLPYPRNREIGPCHPAPGPPSVEASCRQPRAKVLADEPPPLVVKRPRCCRGRSAARSAPKTTIERIETQSSQAAARTTLNSLSITRPWLGRLAGCFSSPLCAGRPPRRGGLVFSGSAIPIQAVPRPGEWLCFFRPAFPRAGGCGPQRSGFLRK